MQEHMAEQPGVATVLPTSAITGVDEETVILGDPRVATCVEQA